MATGARRALRWAPRVLSLAFGGFIAIFALDSFEHGGSAAEVAIGFLLHLLPSVLVLVVLALAWRRPAIGAVGFAALAGLYLAWAWGRLRPASYLPVAAPLLAVAGLFLADAMARARPPSQRSG